MKGVPGGARPEPHASISSGAMQATHAPVPVAAPRRVRSRQAHILQRGRQRPLSQNIFLYFNNTLLDSSNYLIYVKKKMIIISAAASANLKNWLRRKIILPLAKSDNIYNARRDGLGTII